MRGSAAVQNPVISLDRSKIEILIPDHGIGLLLESAQFESDGSPIVAGDSIRSVASAPVALIRDREVVPDVVLIKMVTRTIELRLLFEYGQPKALFNPAPTFVGHQAVRPETWCQVEVTIDSITPYAFAAQGKVLLPRIVDGSSSQLVAEITVSGRF